MSRFVMQGEVATAPFDWGSRGCCRPAEHRLVVGRGDGRYARAQGPIGRDGGYALVDVAGNEPWVSFR